MNRLTKKCIGRAVIILFLCLAIFSFGNGQDEEVISETGEAEVEEEVTPQELVPEITNLDVLLIDNINNSRIGLSNCVLVLAGELRICEDTFTYNNTFASGYLYKITVLVELKDTE